MSIITVPTAFNIDLEFSLAPIHKRLLAWLIDILIIYCFIFGMLRFVMPVTGISEALGDTLTMLLTVIPAYSYHLLMELFAEGRSVGKIAMGLKVMDLTGREATLSQYLLRWIFRIIDVGVTMGAGAVFSLSLTRYNQRLGDLVAGTIVIDQREQTKLQETIYLDISEKGYKVLFPQVMRLTDRDINGIRGLLEMREGSSDNEEYILQVSQRIKEVLQIDTNLEPRELLFRLLSDYNFLTK